MGLGKFVRPAEYIVIALTILLANRGIWLCLTDLNDPLSFCEYYNIGIELLLYFFTSLLAAWLLARAGDGSAFKLKWRNNLLIIAFLLLSLISLVWSVYFAGTAYRLFLLLFSTFLGSFLGVYFSRKRLQKILFWFAAFTVLASWLLLTFFPNAAIMAEPHAGSWRGIFWHKNFTGSLMAFATMIFLFTGLTAADHNNLRKIICAVGYVLALIFVVYSRSAAGVVMWLGLSSATISLFLWCKMRHRLNRIHYLAMAAGVLALVLLVLWKLDFLFGLLNRESSLTGRLPLWDYLLSEAGNRPIFGHGFGAIWLLRDFRAQVTAAQGWSFTITNGHNGYMDILLGLGGLGLLLALSISVMALYRAWRYFINDGRMESSLPFLIALYFLLANLSISFFLELEVFHWVLLVAALFRATSAQQKATTARELTRTNMLLAPREPPRPS